VWGNFSQGGETSGTQRDIAFSQLAVKGLNSVQNVNNRFVLENVHMFRILNEL
jgi:hypothetical protein